ncbi:VanZ family protein [Paenalkalicoccus suaedae]|uniref:VanZ family protein n=2 Tax=Paenalkalicoccus suaedae TaxID=2592382 RepID=A0A859FKK2_9BACI|nr:VanZ family protein [Paenalkalicoccus suaedae]
MLFYILPLAVWISGIVLASSMSYETQNVRPLLQNVPTDWIERSFSWVSFTYGDSVISLQTRSTEAFAEFFIRKGAHVLVFAILAVLLLRLLLFATKRTTLAVTITLVTVAIFAIIDEYRHLLHPNRTGMVEDVILDFLGACLGIAIYLLIIRRGKQRAHVSHASKRL